MITLSAKDLVQVYTCPKVLLNEYREMFCLFTEKVTTSRELHSFQKVHRHDVLRIAMEDEQMKDWMNEETIQRFIITATLVSCKVSIPGTYELYARLGTEVYAKYLEINETTDGLYVIPQFLAVRNINAIPPGSPEWDHE